MSDDRRVAVTAIIGALRQRDDQIAALRGRVAHLEAAMRAAAALIHEDFEASAAPAVLLEAALENAPAVRTPDKETT